MNLQQPFRAEVEKVSKAVSDTFDFLMAKIAAAWNVQHKPDGTHGNITATNLAITRGTDQDVAAGTNLGNVTATGDGPHTFGGDVIAEFGDGTECGLGILSTVNGTALVSGAIARHGLLIGGVATGFFIVKAPRSGVFGGSANFQLTIYDLANAPGTAPMLQLAQDTAVGAYVLIDGGTGSTKLQLGSLARPLLAIFATDLYLGTNNPSVGTWTSVAFAAGNFTGSGTLTWTLQSGDQTTFAYTITQNTMTVSFILATTTVAGAGVSLQIAIPAGKTAVKAMQNAAAFLLDNGVFTTGIIFVAASGAVIQIARSDLANWTAAVNNTQVQGQITFEI